MTFFRDKRIAPFAILLVTIIGNISGVSPTATAIAKKKACDQSPLVIPLIKKTIGNRIITIRINSLLTFAIPLSKAVLILFVVALLAISPKKVVRPVFRMIAKP